MHFAECLEPDDGDIISQVRSPVRIRLLEGIDNWINILKRIARGYRDDSHFFLSLRAEFPGWAKTWY